MDKSNCIREQDKQNQKNTIANQDKERKTVQWEDLVICALFHLASLRKEPIVSSSALRKYAMAVANQMANKKIGKQGKHVEIPIRENDECAFLETDRYKGIITVKQKKNRHVFSLCKNVPAKELMTVWIKPNPALCDCLYAPDALKAILSHQC